MQAQSSQLISGQGAGIELMPGDVFLVANETEQPLDIQAGIKGESYYWHCDHAFNRKARIAAAGRDLLVGLALDPRKQRIYATSPGASLILAFDMAGHEVEIRRPPSRRYGNLLVDRTGQILIGVHSNYGGLAPDDGHGPGKLVRFDPVDGGFEFFDVEIDGGRSGHHCVSGLALTDDERTVFYTSESGRRICRYDLVERRQLPDFHVFDGERDATYGLSVGRSGEMLIATSTGALRMDPAGEIIQRYDVPPVRGWTRARLSPDERHFYLGNFLEGVVQRRRVDTGEVVAELDIKQKGGLTSVVEYAPSL